MGKVFGLAFALVLIGTFVGLDFGLARQAWHGDFFTFGNYVSVRLGAVRAAIGGTSTSDLLPAAPPGWSVREAVTEDTLMATGPDTPEDALRNMQSAEATLYDAIPGHVRLRNTYDQGRTIIVIDIVLIPKDRVQGPGARAFSALHAATTTKALPDPLVVIDGVEMLELHDDKLPGVILAFGRANDQVYLSAISNADYVQTKSILAAIDVAGLIKRAAELPSADGEATSGTTETPPATAIKPVPALGIGSCGNKGAGKFCSVAK